MKKIFRYMTFALSLCTLFSVTSCSWQDKINQLRCEHDFTAGDVIQEATCLEPGSMSRTCDLCGIEDVVEIPAKGHVAVNAGVNVEPTCTRSGYDFGKVCQDCGVVLEKDKLLAPIDHKPVVVTTEGTCSTPGKKDQVICEDCGYILLEGQELFINPDNHMDLDGDGCCDECSIVTVFSNLVEGEEYEMGTPIAGKILRFYYEDSFYSMSLNCNTSSSYDDLPEIYIDTYCIGDWFQVFASSSSTWDFPLCNIVHDSFDYTGYIEIYFAPGDYESGCDWDSVPFVWTIDSDSVLQYKYGVLGRIVVMEKA